MRYAHKCNVRGCKLSFDSERSLRRHQGWHKRRARTQRLAPAVAAQVVQATPASELDEIKEILARIEALSAAGRDYIVGVL